VGLRLPQGLPGHHRAGAGHDHAIPHNSGCIDPTGLLELEQKCSQFLLIALQQQPLKCWSLAQEVCGDKHPLAGVIDLLPRGEAGLFNSPQRLFIREALKQTHGDDSDSGDRQEQQSDINPDQE
jgi:hypothetical protein